MVNLQWPRRLPIRYGLRSLFVLMTVVAIWLVWERQTITKRQRMLMRLETLAGDTWEPYADGISISPTRTSFSVSARPSSSQASWFRRLLGDVGVWSLCLPPEMTAEEKAEYEATLPEACIVTGSQRTPVAPVNLSE